MDVEGNARSLKNAPLKQRTVAYVSKDFSFGLSLIAHSSLLTATIRSIRYIRVRKLSYRYRHRYRHRYLTCPRITSGEVPISVMADILCPHRLRLLVRPGGLGTRLLPLLMYPKTPFRVHISRHMYPILLFRVHIIPYE